MLRLIKKTFHAIFATADRRVQMYLNVVFFCKAKRINFITLIAIRRLQKKYGVFIGYNTIFDKSLVLAHPIGIVIGDGVKIGRNVTIFQNVTIGRSDLQVDSYPIIGNNTIIYSGAAILGKIKIGDNCIIGANAVVTKDVPSGCVAVGVPARVFEKKT